MKNTQNQSSSSKNTNTIAQLTQEQSTESNAIEIPSIALPKGGGALKGIDEKFEVNAANGTASFSIPLPLSPGRNGFAPALALTYNSGGGNSLFGLGWDVGLPSIQRKTDKGLPQYENGEQEDIFMFSGVEDLVPFLKEESDWQIEDRSIEDFTIRQYRPRIEGSFARIERIIHPNLGMYWKVTTPDNSTTFFGRTEQTRIADPEDPNRIFQWLPEFSYDDKGNCLQYEYKAENLEEVEHSLAEHNRFEGIAPFTNLHLKRVRYGNQQPYFADENQPFNPSLPQNTHYFFEVIFDYGEHRTQAVLGDNEAPSYEPVGEWQARPDAFSSYRSGFEIRTYRQCFGVLMYHHFPQEQGFGDKYLVRSLDLEYEPSSINQSGEAEVSYLKSITQTGYIRTSITEDAYSKKSLPPMEFTYQHLDWNKDIKTVDPESIINAPVGLTNNYQWVDLYGEGISGILTEQADAWYYKENEGDIDEDGQVAFAIAKKVAPKPSYLGLSNGILSLQDLEANGKKQIVVQNERWQGFFELTADNDWLPFQAFSEVANIDLRDPNTRLIDLNGDGQPDLVVSEDNVFVWYAANGKKGHQAAKRTAKSFDEERGPSIVFADSEQTIFLADMSGDGLTDIVRIRNGEICYWANKGYGKFSAKINMDDAPIFDHPELFNPQYLHLADVSGTGATDIIYLGKNQFNAYINLSGNAWSTAHEIEPFAPIDNNSQLSVVDLLGTGTSCIVWSSDLPHHANAPMRYIDLMNSKKPHVMIKHINNMGKETSVEYKSSTWFYLKDKQEGKPWITKLPFPVQVVHKTIIEEKVTEVRFASEYHYHHGYYDHAEREFRGFGMVEQLDTEHYETWKKNNAGNQLEQSAELYQAPMLTKTWYHTGAFLDSDHILNQFEQEYWYQQYKQLFPDTPLSVSEPQLEDAILKVAETLNDPNLIENLSADEWREAIRTCKGMVLRQEVFALDGDENPLSEASKKQAKPYSVATHNCHIQLLQPRKEQPYGVFLVTESEALSIQYERDETDPRIGHTLNIKIDDRGNILESASVVYGRQQMDSSLPSHVQLEQAKTHIIYTENQFTNDVIQATAYRARTVAENKTWEITGLNKSSSLYQLADFEGILTNPANEIPYHETATGSNKRRLIEHIRTLYLKDDLTGALPSGVLESKGLSYESYQLAYTPDLLTDIYGDKISDPETTMTEGRFVHTEGDNNWWIRSGLTQFISENENAADAQNRFYLPLAYTDPFGASTKIFYYKDYYLFPESMEDALQNRSKLEAIDFRTLSPTKLRDVNDNLSQVLLDELGLVKAVAILGKDLNGDGIPELELADNLEGFAATFENEVEDITAFFQTENSNELHEIGERLLKNATSRFVYDFEVYQKTGRPAVVASINRETHHHHLAQGEKTALLFGFEYSDGLGQVAMAKAQAEPGLAKQAIVQEDGTFQINEVNTTTEFPDSPRLRWIGNGRTVLNNKGNPVKQYEPYFSITPHYEAAKELVEMGVTPINYYDAPGRLIKTELPNETFSKVEFDSWQQRSFDTNDTVRDSLWYEKRSQNLIDTELIAEGKDPQQEKIAAEKAAKHHNTPAVLHLDSLGRLILSIEHNRIEEKDNLGTVINVRDEFYHTFIDLDIEGNTRSIIDARGNTVMAYRYDVLGHRVYENSMDKGERWLLNNVMGNPVKSWDSRQHIFSTTYDVVQRPLETKVEGGDAAIPLNHIFEKNSYGEGLPNAKEYNLRGQLVEQYDTAGKIQIHQLDIKGNPLKTSRRFALDYKNTVNWQGNLDNLLENTSYTDEVQYDALNRLIWSKTSDGSITQPHYNEAALLEKVEVTQNGASQFFVQNINYDAKGQRESILYGNGVKTTYQYDQQTFQLLQLQSRKATGELLQDLHYTFDPVGNITTIADKAIPTTFFGNHKIEPKSEYTYDALYRLIAASGREHAAQTQFGNTDNWNDIPFLKKYQSGDALAWRNYTQSYTYDSVGNILQMRHQATGGNWTRNYEYENQNNRLISTQIGNQQAYLYPHHAAHGFITSLPHLSRMDWNFKDELKATARQMVNNGTPETTYYVYDGGGERVRKVTETTSVNGSSSTKKEERLYLGGIEIYKKHSGTHSGLERITLHIMDDSRRIAMIDTRNDVDDDTDPKTLRYQLGNHLGSATLEVDDTAAVISYEEYHPYGTTAYQAVNAAIKTAAKHYRYTGMERDEESGLNYHSARYYLVWLGRWLKGDPIGVGDGVNVYQYSGNNPIVFYDSNGNEKESARMQAMRKLAAAESRVKRLTAELNYMSYTPEIQAEMESELHLAQAQLKTYQRRFNIVQKKHEGRWEAGHGGYKKSATASFFAGFGHVVSFGLTSKINNATGSAAVVNKKSAAYKVGKGLGVVNQGLMGGVGLAKSIGTVGLKTTAKRFAVGGGVFTGLQHGADKIDSSGTTSSIIAVLGSYALPWKAASQQGKSSITLEYTPGNKNTRFIGHNKVKVTSSDGASQSSHLIIPAKGESLISSTKVKTGVTIPVSSEKANAALTLSSQKLGQTGSYCYIGNNCATYSAQIMNSAGLKTLPFSTPLGNYSAAYVQTPSFKLGSSSFTVTFGAIDSLKTITEMDDPSTPVDELSLSKTGTLGISFGY